MIYQEIDSILQYLQSIAVCKGINSILRFFFFKQIWCYFWCRFLFATAFRFIRNYFNYKCIILVFYFHTMYVDSSKYCDISGIQFDITTYCIFEPDMTSSYSQITTLKAATSLHLLVYFIYLMFHVAFVVFLSLALFVSSMLHLLVHHSEVFFQYYVCWQFEMKIKKIIF